MHRADLRGEATAVIAKAASALLYDTAVWYLVWVCGRVGVCFVFCGWMSDAMGSKTWCKLFRLSFWTGRSSRKSPFFRLDPPVGKLNRRRLSRKSPFSTV